MTLFWAILLAVGVLAAWLLTLIGMPGNWLMVAATAIYVWLIPKDAPTSFGWSVVVVLLVLAALGEVTETIASAAGAARQGGSRRGAVLALLGSILGGLAGLFVGIPVPIVGSLIAAVLFGGLGALIGAILGEKWKGRELGASWEIGKAAFWGRLLGTLAKALLGAVMVAVVLVALAT